MTKSSCGRCENCTCGKEEEDHHKVEFPEELKEALKPLVVKGDNAIWYRPTSLEKLLSLRAAGAEMLDGNLEKKDGLTLQNVTRFVGGYTDVGYRRLYRSTLARLLVNLNDIPDLKAVEFKEDALTIGAACTITSLEEACEHIIAVRPEHEGRFFKSVLNQTRFFANRMVRNVGTIGGTLNAADALADMIPPLMAVDAQCFIMSTEGHRYVSVRDYVTAGRTTCLKDNEMLVSVTIPYTRKNQFYQTFKFSKRREDTQATVNAGFMVEFDEDMKTVKDCWFTYGAIASTQVTARKTREYLIGKEWNGDAFKAAVKLIAEEVQPAGRVGRFEYRRAAILGVFAKFFIETCVKIGATVPEDVKSAAGVYERLPSTSIQDLEDPKEGDQAGRMVHHQSADAHVTGDAKYPGDIDMPRSALHGALLTSTKPHAKIVSIDASEALAVEGVVAFYSAKDIPGGNILGSLIDDEEIFASETVNYYAHPMGILVAKTEKLAWQAVKLVKVVYEELPFINTIDEAIEKDSYFEDWDREIVRGDLAKGLGEADFVVKGTQYTTPQDHFYIETQNCTIIPGADEMRVFSASQNLSQVHRAVCRITGLPEQKVVSTAMRIGGGFGGKQDRSQFLAAQTALAAHLTGKAVRVALPRDIDLQITGMRHGFKCDYTLGIKKDGTITGMELVCWNNGGHSLDLSSAVMDRGLWTAENGYYVPNIRLWGRSVRTNRVSNTAYRGFGVPQCIAMTETAIEHAAQVSGISAQDIRLVNLYKPHQRAPIGSIGDTTVRRCMKQLLSQAEIEKRRADIAIFNENNRYKKRALTVMPCRQSVGFEANFMNAGACLVHVYIDGSVQVSHGGVEMGQGIHTKMSQIAAQVLGCPYEMVRTTASTTDKVPNQHPTAGSSGSDLQGWGVRNACAKILDRLEQYRSKNPEASWKDLVNMAYFDKTSLSATGYFGMPNYVYDYITKEGDPAYYLIWNSLAVEVELDVLSGDFFMRRVDVVQDLGHSINPAIDVGQFEGAFMQGMGLFTIEDPIWDTKDAHLRTRNVSTLKIPTFDDSPVSFNYMQLKNSENPLGILGQKSTGEIGIPSGFAVFLAVQDVVNEYRLSAGLDRVILRSPATLDRIKEACPVDFEKVFDDVKPVAALPAPKIECDLAILPKAVEVNHKLLTDAQLEAELSKCLSCAIKPCLNACPVRCSPADFIMAAKLNMPSDIQRAAAMIMAMNPLGTVCGAVCPEQHCRSACSRKDIDAPINIPAIQATLVEKARKMGVMPKFECKVPATGKTIAIIGAGPSGLATAGVLASRGHKVVVYEAREKAGGDINTIPNHRLPKEMVTKDIEFLQTLGDIEIILEAEKTNPEALLAEGFDAVAVACGNSIDSKMGVDGSEHTIAAREYLRENIDVGLNIAVIGGGPVACDCACEAIRRGASSVTMFYRRGTSEMPIDNHDRKLLNEFSIEVMGRHVPTKFEKEGDKVKMTVQRVKMPNRSSGKTTMINVGKPIEWDMDAVIMAIGQKPGMKKEFGDDRVFMAGDFAHGGSTVVEAVAYGKNVGMQIHQKLSGEEMIQPENMAISDVAMLGYEHVPADLTTDFFGLNIPNPFLLSASPMSDGYEQMRDALNAGWAGGVLKTAFDGLPIHIPNQYMTKMDDQTFGNCDNVSGHYLDRVVEEIKKLRVEFPDRLIIGGTGGPLSGDLDFDKAGWQHNTIKLEKAGAMAVEYSLSCPQGGDGSEGAIASQSAKVTERIITWVMECSDPNIPKLFKMTGAVTSMEVIAKAALKAINKFPGKKGGITLANSFPCMNFKEEKEGDDKWEKGIVYGMAGKGVLPISYLTLASVAHLGLEISGNGGVMDYKGAANFLALGTNTVQFCTLPTKYGEGIIDELNSGLAHLMKARGIKTVKELRGIANPNPIADFMDLTPLKKISALEKTSDCIRCGNCSRCPYDAIELSDDIENYGMPIRFDASKCVGCSWCVLNCPGKCLTMRERSAEEWAVCPEKD
eukprot:TRINITY_DN3019_c0_g1_i5.p1 TRINITY_DN3019_c0_g1~~TRINITY_DN3019_c0_g1_i5.p1  ORF type:complete len:2202 (+),score=790.89 TRINITY_DN3019_c0_g1_i5:653-6607(+)